MKNPGSILGGGENFSVRHYVQTVSEYRGPPVLWVWRSSHVGDKIMGVMKTLISIQHSRLRLYVSHANVVGCKLNKNEHTRVGTLIVANYLFTTDTK